MIKDNKILYKRIFTVVGITIAILVVQIVVIIFLVSSLNKAMFEIKQKQKLLAIAKAERLSSVTLQNDFKKIEQFLPVLESTLSDENNLYYVLAQLESLGEKTGNKVSVQITGSQPIIDENGIKYVTFNASAAGNYESLRRYFKELNSSPIFVKISGVNIAGLPSINNNSNIGFTGKIYIK